MNNTFYSFVEVLGFLSVFTTYHKSHILQYTEMQNSKKGKWKDLMATFGDKEFWYMVKP